MKKMTRDLQISFSKVASVDFRLVFFLITLGMLIIGAGAPDAGGSIVH
jgi:hypothetical protein